MSAVLTRSRHRARGARAAINGLPGTEPFVRLHRRYDHWFERHRAAYVSELLAVRALLPWEGRALEIGVGTGRFAGPLGVAFGIDPAREVLGYARRRGVTVARAVAEALPFSDAAFDHALVVTTLCFVADPGAMLRETARVLRPRGLIVPPALARQEGAIRLLIQDDGGGARAKGKGPMTHEITESMVREALGRVAHPGVTHRSLLELGMVADVEIRAEQVRVVLALPHADAPMREPLVQQVRQAVGGIRTGVEVVVETVEMGLAERESFLARVREEQRHPPSAAGIETVLAVMSGKGGVGKSSVAGLLAATLHRRGFEVGLLDADITGPSIPRIFGIVEAPEAGPEGLQPARSRTGIKVVSVSLLLASEDQPVIWRGPLISRAIDQFWRDFAWGHLGYLVVDLPPGTSDAALTVLQSLRLGEIVLVTSPQDLAGMVVRKAASMAKQLGVPIVGVVENMSHVVCPRCGARIEAYGPSRAEDTARRSGLSLLGSLPLDPALAVMCDQGKLEDYRSEAFEGIVDRILERHADRARGDPVVSEEVGR